MSRDKSPKKRKKPKSLTERYAQLNHLYQKAPIGMCHLDRDLRYVSINERLAAMNGKPAEEHLARTIHELIPEMAEEVAANCHSVLETGEPLLDLELQSALPSLHDDQRYWLASYYPLTEEDTVSGVGIVVQEITERKRVEDALQQSERRYRGLVDNALDVIFTLSGDGTITSLNPAFETITGWSRAEWTGKNFAPLIHPEDLPLAQALFQQAMQGELLPLFELRVHTKSGDTVIGEFTSTPQFQDGKVVGMLGIARDLTERKQTERQITLANERLRHLLSSSSVVIYTAEPSGQFANTFVSENVVQLLGYQPQEFLDNPNFCLEHMPAEDAQRIQAELPQVLEQNQCSFEYRIQRQDGSYIWVRDEIRLARDAEGNPLELVGYMVDITERKQAEEALRESEATARALLNAPIDAVCLIDTEGTMLDANEAMARRFNKSVDELIGLNAWTLMPPEVVKRRKTHIDKVIQSGKPLRFEDERVGIWNDNILYPIFDTEGKVAKVAVYGHDITERKHTEQALTQEKEFTEAALNAQMDTFFVFEPSTGKAIRWNKAFSQISGYSDEEIQSMKAPQSYYDEEDLRKAAAAIQQIFQEGSATIELSLVTKDGRKVPTEYLGSLLRGSQGEPQYIIAVGRDITKRKQDEEKLRRLETAVTQSIDGIAVADLDGYIQFVNPAWAEMHGYRVDELLSKHLSLFHTQEQMEKDVIPFNQQVEKTGAKQGEVGHVRKDGSTFPTWMSSTLLRDNQGNPLGFVGIARDSTERKRTLAEIVRARDDWARTFDAVPDLISIVDKEYRILRVNKAMAQRFGRTAEELRGQTCYQLVHGTDHPPESCPHYQLLQDGKAHSAELREEHLSSDFFVSVTPLHDTNGTLIGSVHVARDITERKRIEKALRESEERLRLTIEATRDGLWENTPDHRHDFFSDRMFTMLGYEPVEHKNGFTLLQSLIHPDDLPRLEAAHDGLLQQDHEDYWVEYRMKAKDGSWRHILSRGRCIQRDEQGRPTRVLGTHSDITELKRMEEALRESEQTARALLNAPTDVALLIDTNGTILDANKSLAEQTGLSMNQLIGSCIWNLGPPEVAERTKPAMKKVVESHKPLHMVDEREGRYYDSVAYPILDVGGNVTKIAVIARDITERKKAEDALRESEAKYRNLAESLREVVYRAEPEHLVATYVNQAVEHIFGYTAEEWLQDLTLWDRCLHPDDKARVWAEAREALAKQQAGIIEYRIVTKDKRVRWVQDHMNWKLDEAGKVVSITGLLYDITERKEAEDALQQAHQELERRVEERTAELAEANEELKREIIERQRLEEALEERLHFGTLLSTFSARFINLPSHEVDEEIDWVLWFLITFLEIDRSCLFEFSREDPQLRVTHSWAAQGLDPLPLGMLKEKFPWLLQKTLAGEAIAVSHVEDLPEEATAEQQYLRREGIKSMLVIPLSVAGSVIGALSFSSVRSQRTWHDEQVNRLRLVGEIFANALMRKRSEEELRTKERNLAGAQRIAQLGSWNWNIVTNELRWSDETYGIFGLQPQQFGATYEAFMALVHTDDRFFVNEAVQKALSDPQTEYSIEHRVIRPDGIERIVHERGEVTFDQHNKPLRMIGTVQDITQRKQAEQATFRLAEIIHHASDGVILTDDIGRILYVNPSFERMSGFTLMELENHDPTELVVTDDQKAIGDEIRGTVRTKGEWTGELLCRRKNGAHYLVESRVFAIRDEKGELVEIAAIQQDITPRRRAELERQILAQLAVQLVEADNLEAIALPLSHAADELFDWDALFFGERIPGTHLFRTVYAADIMVGKRVSLAAEDTFPEPFEGVPQILEGKSLLMNRELEEEASLIRFGDTSRPSKSLMYVPVSVAGDLYGFISVQSYEPHEYGEDDLALLESLAGIVAPAIRRTQAEKALREREESERQFSQQLSALHQVSIELSMTTSFDHLCHWAIELGRTRLGFDRLSLWFIDQQDPQWEIGSFGIDEQGNIRDERGERHHIETHPGLAELLKHKIDHVYQRRARLTNPQQEDLGRGEHAVAALWDGEKVIGFLNTDTLLSRQPISENQRRILTLYARTLSYLCTQIRDQEALRQSEERYRTLTQNLPVGLYRTAPGPWGRILMANPALARMLGYQSVEELLDSPVAQYYANSSEREALFEQLTAQDKITAAEIALKKKDATLVWGAVTAHVVRDQQGEVEYVDGMIQDITERKRAEQERYSFAQLALKLVEADTLEAIALSLSQTTDQLFHWDALLFSERVPDTDFFRAVYMVDTIDEKRVSLPIKQDPSAYDTHSIPGLLQGKPVLLNRRTETDAPLIRYGDISRPCASLMFVPLSFAGNIYGFVSVQSYQPNRYTQADLDLLSSLAGIIAPAVRRAHVERALRDSEERYRSLTHNVPVGLYRSTPEPQAHFIMGNSVIARMFGYESVEELLDINVATCFADSSEYQEFAQWLTAKGRISAEELRLRRKDGTLLWGSVSANVVRNEFGEVQYIDGLIQDITQRKQALEDAHRLRQELAHISRVATMGELAASLAHQLNQPLAAVLSNAQAAQRFLGSETPEREQLEEVRNALTDIAEDARRAGEVIRQLRGLLKKTEAERTILNLNEIIEEVIGLVYSEAVIRDISMKLELDPQLPTVLGDRIQLQQVLINLLVNASEAMPDDKTKDREIIVRSSIDKSGNALVAIKDSGVGLSPGSLEQIFEPFFTTKPEGMGMGLSINRSIIETHGGTLWATPNPDQGVTFYFTLPLHQEDYP